MKTLLSISILSFLLFGCSKKPAVEYDEAGRIIRIIHEKEKKETRISYYNNGNKIDSVEYVNGLMQGIKKGWNEEGKQYYQTSYRNGEKHGAMIEWANGKDTISQSNWENGNRHGKQQTWYETGEKKSEAHYVNGVIDGEKYSWFKNGSVKGYGAYTKGTGKYIERFESGDTALIEELKNGALHGAYKTWYDNGKICEIRNYSEGKYQGTWQKWNYNGKLVHESNWLYGEKHGKYNDWYESGIKNEESYWINGKRNGTCRKYYQTGELFKEGNFKDNTGKFTEFHKNKRKRLTGEYLAGKKHNRWEGWSTEGELLFTCAYNNDVKRESIQWTEKSLPQKVIIIKASGYVPDRLPRKDIDAITEATSVGGNTYLFTDYLQFEFAYHEIKAEILDYYEKEKINSAINNEIGLIVFAAPTYSSRFPQQLYDLLPGISDAIKRANIPTTTLASCRFFDSGNRACSRFENDLAGRGLKIINGIACVHEFEDKEWETKIVEFVERLVEKSSLK